MVSSAQTALSVRLLLLDLEASTGLVDLSEGERNLLAALILCGGSNTLVKPGDLRQHPLAAGLTHPTYHRMLRGLIELGVVEYKVDKIDGRGYTIVWTEAMLPQEAKAEAAE